MQYYPFHFKEILRDYGFGNRWIIDSFQKSGLPDNHRIAETWEICDRPGESSLLLNGPLAGLTLQELIHQDPTGVLGSEIVGRFGKTFPLLIKLLDVSNTLGEQVHHSDALAAKENLKDPGKTEAWYILDTRPGAQIYCGQKNDAVDRKLLRESLRNGTIKDTMRSFEVNPGDSFLLYAGTMHYSPGGVLFYEIMQNSDVYIGLRKPDENLPISTQRRQEDLILEGIHLENGYNCKIVPLRIEAGPNKRYFVMACQHFALERLDLHAEYQINGQGAKFFVFTLIEGDCEVRSRHGNLRLNAGQSCLIPAALKEASIVPTDKCSLLKAYVPNLLEDVVEPLRFAGYANEAIRDLGGRTRLNPLIEITSDL